MAIYVKGHRRGKSVVKAYMRKPSVLRGLKELNRLVKEGHPSWTAKTYEHLGQSLTAQLRKVAQKKAASRNRSAYRS